MNEEDIQNNIKNTIREVMFSEFEYKINMKLEKSEFED